MIRDMDLVRKILIEVEKNPSPYRPIDLKIDGYSEKEIGYHVAIMMEAGLLANIFLNRDGQVVPISKATRLTWGGHDFLDACRDDSRWNTAKGVLNEMGGASIDVVKMVLIKLMETQALALIS